MGLLNRIRRWNRFRLTGLALIFLGLLMPFLADAAHATKNGRAETILSLMFLGLPLAGLPLLIFPGYTRIFLQNRTRVAGAALMIGGLIIPFLDIDKHPSAVFGFFGCELAGFLSLLFPLYVKAFIRQPLRVAGVALVISGLWLLIFAPDNAIIFLFLGLGCFVPGFLLVIFASEIKPEGLDRRRKELAAQLARGGWKPVVISARTFRYRLSSWAYGLILLMAAGFMFGLPALIYFAAKDRPSGGASADLLYLSGLFLLFGLLLILYLYRLSHIRIAVDSWGLRAQRLFGSAEIPWHEIVEFKKFEVNSLGAGKMGDIYKVYSLNKAIEFYQSLEGAKELAALIDDGMTQTWS